MSNPSKKIFAQRMIDVEIVFRRMKGVLGMRRAHLREEQVLYNYTGLILVSMNLMKLTLKLQRKAIHIFMRKQKQKKNGSLSNSVGELKLYVRDISLRENLGEYLFCVLERNRSQSALVPVLFFTLLLYCKQGQCELLKNRNF